MFITYLFIYTIDAIAKEKQNNETKSITVVTKKKNTKLNT